MLMKDVHNRWQTAWTTDGYSQQMADRMDENSRGINGRWIMFVITIFECCCIGAIARSFDFYYFVQQVFIHYTC